MYPYLVLHKGILIAARRLQGVAVTRTAVRGPRRRVSRRALEDLHELLAHLARCLVIAARAGPSTEVLLRAFLGRSASPFPVQRHVSATAGSKRRPNRIKEEKQQMRCMCGILKHTCTGSPLGCAAESESARRAVERAGASVPCSAVQPPVPPVSAASPDATVCRSEGDKTTQTREPRPCRGSGSCVLEQAGSGEVWCERLQPLPSAALAPRRKGRPQPSRPLPRAAFSRSPREHVLTRCRSCRKTPTNLRRSRQARTQAACLVARKSAPGGERPGHEPGLRPRLIGP